jgi:hypothetical protein
MFHHFLSEYFQKANHDPKNRRFPLRSKNIFKSTLSHRADKPQHDNYFPSLSGLALISKPKVTSLLHICIGDLGPIWECGFQPTLKRKVDQLGNGAGLQFFHDMTAMFLDGLFCRA